MAMGIHGIQRGMGQFIAELPYEIPLSTVTCAMSAEKIFAKWEIYSVYRNNIPISARINGV